MIFSESDEPIIFKYKFEFDNNTKKEFKVEIDPETLLVKTEEEITPPDWALLEKFKCPNCPLDLKKHKYCPLAKHMSVVIDFFTELPSFKEAKVMVETNERITYKHTTVQIGVGSLMGIIMASSGCPVIGELKPLVRFHLPFASLEETEYRVLSMYILAQYFKLKRNEQPDWDLLDLKRTYEEIQTVNKNVVVQLSDVEMNDSSRNAVVTLSNFAEFIIFGLEEKEFKHLQDFLKEFGDMQSAD